MNTTRPTTRKRTMADVRAANKAIGHTFFSAANRRFFASRVETALYRERWFITSEKAGFESTPRVYTIREALTDGRIDIVGEPHQYPTLDAARDALRTHISTHA